MSSSLSGLKNRSETVTGLLNVSVFNPSAETARRRQYHDRMADAGIIGQTVMTVFPKRSSA